VAKFIKDTAHQFLSKSVNICWSYAHKYFGDFMSHSVHFLLCVSCVRLL